MNKYKYNGPNYGPSIISDIFKDAFIKHLLKPNGKLIPPHRSSLRIGELIVIKDNTYKVSYMNDATLVLEPINAQDLNIKSEQDPRNPYALADICEEENK